MGPRSVLIIGGTGKISSACVTRALEHNFEVTVMNRGQTTIRPLPQEVRVLRADASDIDGLTKALGKENFDTVVQFIAREPQQVATDLKVFAQRTGQYIFISSTSVYQRPVARLPLTESTPLVNPFWQYSQDKITCELMLTQAYRDNGFPATIVRPGQTYDKTGSPLDGGWTIVNRMLQGKAVIVHGDGTSLWVLTHQDDFARALVRLFGNPVTIGDAVHITSDEVQTWNQIYEIMAAAAEVEPHIVHVTSDKFAQAIPDFGPRLLGDRSHSVIYDNSKVRQFVPGWHAEIPFVDGAREIIEWHNADPGRRQVDLQLDAAMDALVASI